MARKKPKLKRKNAAQISAAVLQKFSIFTYQHFQHLSVLALCLLQSYWTYHGVFLNARVTELDLQTISVMGRTFYQGAIMSPAAHHASKACLLPGLVQTGIGPSQWRHFETNDYDYSYRFASLMAAFMAWCETYSSTWQSYMVPIAGKVFSIFPAGFCNWLCLYFCVSQYLVPSHLLLVPVFLAFPWKSLGLHRCTSRRLCFSCTLVTLISCAFAAEMHFIDNFFRLLLAAWFQAWLGSKRVKVWSGLLHERGRS